MNQKISKMNMPSCAIPIARPDTKAARPFKNIILRCEDGFTLFEILIAVLLLAIAIAPIVAAFKPALFATSSEEELSVFTHRARGTLNRAAALSFATLDANQGNPANLTNLFGSASEAAKETFTFKGDSYTPTVAITDQSSGAGGLLEITVTAANVSVQTLKTEY